MKETKFYSQKQKKKSLGKWETKKEKNSSIVVWNHLVLLIDWLAQLLLFYFVDVELEEHHRLYSILRFFLLHCYSVDHLAVVDSLYYSLNNIYLLIKTKFMIKLTSLTKTSSATSTTTTTFKIIRFLIFNFLKNLTHHDHDILDHHNHNMLHNNTVTYHMDHNNLMKTKFN